MPFTDYGTALLPSSRRRRSISISVLFVFLLSLFLTLFLYHRTPSPLSTSSLSSSPSISVFQTSNIDNTLVALLPFSLPWLDTNTPTSSYIQIDTSIQYQEILGFGGAFTEAAAIQFLRLSVPQQNELLHLYFDPIDGSNYIFGRIPMGSCDFCIHSYSLNDHANDTAMEHFDMDLQHDSKTIIPFLKRALAKRPDLKLLTTPWSPPSWMKQAHDNQPLSMLNSRFPNGLNPDYRTAYALYFSKFIQAYKIQNISFWAITPQNEPQFPAPWEACTMDAQFEADFIGNFLGPKLKEDFPELKILMYDHNRGSVDYWAKTLYKHPLAQKYISGMAFHWYDETRIMDGVNYHERLNDSHFIAPDRFMLSTESSNCPGIAMGDEAYFRGQRYAHDILTDLNNYVAGWIDWNLILDARGGPNHLNNFCDAPLVMDAQGTGFFIQPMFYFIQHFSRYIVPGSKRVAVHVHGLYDKPGKAQLFVGYPVTLHSCDRSARQALYRTSDGKIQIADTGFCVSVIDRNWQGMQVELVECVYLTTSWIFKGDSIQKDGLCLGLNHGSTENGVRLMMQPCNGAKEQQWEFIDNTLQSKLAGKDQCATAGYSFLQATAFLTPQNKHVLVVLNENSEPATFQIQHGHKRAQATIPMGAIQTFVFA